MGADTEGSTPATGRTRSAATTAASRAAYDRLAARYDRRWARYVEASVRETLRRIAVQPGGRVLDVGCGTGSLLRALGERTPSAVRTGADLSPAMLERARAKLGADVALVAADAEALPFARASFDVVVSTSSLHFWSHPERGLAEIARVLRPGGRIAITDWCSDFLSVRLLDRWLRLRHRRERPALGTAALSRLLERAGFRELQLERYRIGWPWGLMTATGRWEAGSR